MRIMIWIAIFVYCVYNKIDKGNADLIAYLLAVGLVYAIIYDVLELKRKASDN